MRHSVRRFFMMMMVVVVGLSMGACQQEVQVVEAPAPPDLGAELGPITDAFIGVWNSKDYARMDTILATDFHREAPDQNADGVEGMKTFMGQVHAAYSDFHITITDSAYAENLSFIHWTVTGTFTPEGGEGVEVTTPGITMLRFAAGKVTDEIVYYDTAAMAEKLGTAEVPHVE